MKVIGVIPARWASTRFAGKVLVPLAGKPMIQHVWERVSQSKLLDEVIIACDHENVLKAAKDFGAQTVMTSADHPSGTDRIAEAVSDKDVQIVVNIQGDEPLIDSKAVDDLVHALINDDYCLMATLIKKITEEEDVNDPNVVKVVTDDNHNALYFSRSAIPFNRDGLDVQYYKHIGIYAYRKEFLLALKDMPASSLEKIEKLEQLRVLQAGYKIKTVLTDFDSVGVDTKEDIAKVEKILNG